MKLAIRLLLCLIVLGAFIALRGYAFLLGSGSDNYAATVYTQYGASPTATGTVIATPTATATQTIAATPTATATATPAVGALPLAITAMLGDVGNGTTNPIPTLCAAPNGSGTCTTRGSASVVNIPHNGTDASSALQIALNAGDVNLPAFTYTINTEVVIPSWRTLQCQPGTVLTTTNTTLKILSITNVGQVSVIGCTFSGTGASPASAEYATYATGGGNINFIGNTVTGFPSSSAVTFTATQNDVIELNQFSGNHDSGLLVTGSTHIINVFNNTGALSPPMPAMPTVGGTALQRDLGTVLNALGASGTAVANGYGIVSPGSVFGGASCHGDNSANDEPCIVNALSTNANGIVLAAGTGASPWYRIATTISGSQVNGKTIICQPGARLFDPAVAGTGSGGNQQMFEIGAQGFSGGSNVNLVGCQLYGAYVPNGSNGSRYNEILQIGSDNGTSQIHGLGLDFQNCFGDCFITYSPCGTALNPGGCQGGTAATSGPTDISLLMSNLYQANQPTVHINGGQQIHIIFSATGDGDFDPEVDTNVMQIEGASFDNIYSYSIQGVLNNINETWRSGGLSCSGRQDVGANYSNCYMHDVLADGVRTTNANGGPWYPANGIQTTIVSGCQPGSYSGNATANGGTSGGGHC